MSALALIAAVATPIIGGTATTTSDYPAVVVVDIQGTLCTGEVVDPSWVMTAAHCLDPAELNVPAQSDVTARVQVHQGTVNYPTDLGTADHADQTYLDPMWNHDHFGKHDMGLIHLMTPLAVTPLVANFKASLAPVGIEVTMVGFGTTTGSTSATAGVEYQLTDQVSATCSDFTVGSAATNSDSDLLCFSQVSGMGTCFGDSGGPLIAMVDGVQTIVGITSFGDNACDVYGAYTRTNAEVDFVQSMIPALCADDACVDPSSTNGGCDAGGGAGGGGALVIGLCAMAAHVRRRRRALTPRARTP